MLHGCGNPRGRGHLVGQWPRGRSCCLDDPVDAQRSDLFFQSADGQLEFSLLQRDSNEPVRKWRALPVLDKCMEERKAILAAGNGDGNLVARPQHGETAHGPAQGFENLGFYGRMHTLRVSPQLRARHAFLFIILETRSVLAHSCEPFRCWFWAIRGQTRPCADICMEQARAVQPRFEHLDGSDSGGT